MIKAPKISINLPLKCGSTTSTSNVQISDSNRTPASTSITKIIAPPVEQPAPNVVRRHSFRKETVTPVVNIQSQSYSNLHSSYEGTIEQAILRSTVPININENEEISVLGQRGIWANKSEILNWNGPVPISQYRINEDTNAEIIHKTSAQPVEYTQEIQVRYLRPPTPPVPGELIIKQESSVQQLPPAPPQIIRQHAPRPITPEPLVIREAPPEPPVQVPRKVITISGQHAEAPPRKVIIEKLPPLPPKPQPVIIERWLPYQQQKRRVIYESSHKDVHYENPRNIIIEWQSPAPVVKKSVENAEPREYLSRYGSTLKKTSELPSFVKELETEGQHAFKKVAQEYTSGAPELEGDVEALKYLDPSTLEREGLHQYRHYVLGNPASSFRESHLTSSVLHSNEYNLNLNQSHSIGITYNSDNNSASLHW